jgi:hypothetical protein
MSGPRIVIATPFDGGDLQTARVTLGYHQFVRALEREMGANVIDGSIMFACDVVRARNRAVGHILRDIPDVTHVLWLDDDNYPAHIPSGIAAVRHMIDCCAAVVGAPYTRKRKPAQWVHQALQGATVDGRGLMPVAGLGFGFTMTSRDALAQLDFQAERYVDLPNPHAIGNLFGQLYGTDSEGRRYLMSEDYSFCARWRDLGRQCYVLARSPIIVHAGMTEYVGG